MSATILDGRKVASATISDLRLEVEQFVEKYGRRPLLATVLVGDDPASKAYVRMKVNRCRDAGIGSRRLELGSSITTADLCKIISELSADPDVDGILLQHPMPSHIDERKAFDAIDSSKDVDGVTQSSFANMAFGGRGFASATPGGIMALLDKYEVSVAGRHAVIIGRSAILGKPMGMLLLGRDATVTYSHSKTTDLHLHVQRADILVAAAGHPGLVRGEWIKPGAVVIDAGYADNRGDVDFGPAAQRASMITPVPGGVGPMTIATLLVQTVRAAYRRQLTPPSS